MLSFFLKGGDCLTEGDEKSGAEPLRSACGMAFDDDDDNDELGGVPLLVLALEKGICSFALVGVVDATPFGDLGEEAPDGPGDVGRLPLSTRRRRMPGKLAPSPASVARAELRSLLRGVLRLLN